MCEMMQGVRGVRDAVEMGPAQMWDAAEKKTVAIGV